MGESSELDEESSRNDEVDEVGHGSVDEGLEAEVVVSIVLLQNLFVLLFHFDEHFFVFVFPFVAFVSDKSNHHRND